MPKETRIRFYNVNILTVLLAKVEAKRAKEGLSKEGLVVRLLNAFLAGKA